MPDEIDGAAPMPDGIEEELNDVNPDPDPYRHLRPVMANAGDAGEYVVHATGCKLAAVGAERNLWELVVAETGIVTFDADQWSTTIDLGMYLDGVISGLIQEGQDSASSQRGRGELDTKGFQ